MTVNIPITNVTTPETVPVEKIEKELRFVEHSIKGTKKHIKETKKRLKELEGHLLYEKGIKSALEDMLPVPTLHPAASVLNTETGVISSISPSSDSLN